MTRKKVFKILDIIFDITLAVFGIAFIVYVGWFTFDFGDRIFNEVSVDNIQDSISVKVKVPEGISNKELAKLMYDKGLTKDEDTFYYQILVSDFRKTIVAGTHTLNTAMTPTEILKELSQEAEKDEE